MKKQKIIITVLSVFVVGILGMRGMSLWPEKSIGSPQLTPTKQISEETSVGGIVASTTPSQDSTTQSDAPNHVPATPPSTRGTADNAPKQTEITKKVKNELPYYALGASNDPLSQSSWALTATKAQQAWDTSTGNGIVVAVVDSGFALAHEDLTSQWYKNTSEMGQTISSDRCWTGAPVDKSNNGCDDDNNGYVDDWRGWDFVNRTNNPQAGRTNPNGSGVAHGTEVAGLVGAAGNNGKGIATYAWNTKILPLQVLSDNGSGYTSSIAAAIYYAVDRGAQIINMSLGGSTPDTALSDAITYAYNHNVVVVAAAGNCGTGTEAGCDPAKPGAMGYPALDKHVIAVGASTSTNARASFSSYGPGLDVVAPGSGAIASTMWTPTNQTSAYASNLYGTSFASPMVSGYIALLKSIRPNTSVDDITSIVDGTAQKVTAMNQNVYTDQFGHGLINADVSLTVAKALNGSAGAKLQLLQTGSERSEQTFSSLSTLSSGCTSSSPVYCTIWAIDENGFDRYLPYSMTSAAGAGWTWNGASLSDGTWFMRSRSGEAISDRPYILFQK